MFSELCKIYKSGLPVLFLLSCLLNCADFNAQGAGVGLDMLSGQNQAITENVTSTSSIHVTVVGLSGSATPLVLQNNGGNDLSIPADGSFTFSTKLAPNEVYNVSVLTQPTTPAKTCSISGGAGTVVSGDISSITVNCSVNTHTVSVNVADQAGTGLKLQNNGGDNLNVNSNGTVAFATALADGAAYAVTVTTQPSGPAQTCSVASGAGTMAAANVTLDTAIADGASYVLSVQTQPTGPAYTCSIGNGAGSIASANGTNIYFVTDNGGTDLIVKYDSTTTGGTYTTLITGSGFADGASGTESAQYYYRRECPVYQRRN